MAATNPLDPSKLREFLSSRARALAESASTSDGVSTVNTFGFDCLRRAIPPRQIHEKVKSTEERAEVVCTVELDVGRISVTVSWSYIVDRRSYTCTDRPRGCTWWAKRRKER